GPDDSSSAARAAEANVQAASAAQARRMYRNMVRSSGGSFEPIRPRGPFGRHASARMRRFDAVEKRLSRVQEPGSREVGAWILAGRRGLRYLTSHQFVRHLLRLPM